MSQFLGVPVLVTLQDGAQLRGIVASIVPQVSLTLRHVCAPLTGRTLPEYTLEVAQILALETDENVKPLSTNVPEPVPTEPIIDVPAEITATKDAMRPDRERSSTEQPEYSAAPQPSNFEDPAILRVGKKPSITLPNRSSLNIGSPKRDDAKLSEVRKSANHRDRIPNLPSRQKLPSNLAQERQERISRPPSPAANLIDPASFSRGDFKPNREQATRGVTKRTSISNIGTMPKNSHDSPALTAKARRPRRKRQPKAREDITEFIEPGNVTPSKETKPSKGWRQTPLLAETRSFQPFSTLKKGKAQKNGWGTEDASDVQDMGDFDFESNLMKFDKHTVFGQIKAEDMTADEDRLVSHNRVPKPGTAGGKNLHHTENVLDTPNATNGRPAQWNSEAGDSDEEIISHRGSGSGRTSRIAEIKSGLNRRSNSRMASSITSSHPNSRPQTSMNPNSKSSFYLVNANRKCDVVSALQALNLENIANSELGLTEDMMTENAARGIAEVALSALSSGNRRLAVDDVAMPIVVIFAGNNKSGQRAVAAGRHLRNHGVHVIVCVLGLEREPELLEDLRRQLKVFRNFGGKVFRKIDMLEHLKTLDANVELVIDGLLGLTMTIEELRTGDQATIYELITWANRSKANVLAIDIPSGIDPTSGKIAIIEGSPLYLEAKYVVSMSAPKKGLLQAMISGEGHGWQLFVADVGIPDAAWRKGGTRMRRGVEFDQDWVVGLRFQHA